MTDQNNSDTAPSMLGGHAKLAYAMAEVRPPSLVSRQAHAHAQGAIGSVTGSQAYTQSGEADKQAAVDEMKAAGAQQDTHADPNTLTGKAENVRPLSCYSCESRPRIQAIGSAVGCDGLKSDYETSETQQGQRDQFASTHGEH